MKSILSRLYAFFGIVILSFAFPALATAPAKTRTLYQNGALTVYSAQGAKSTAKLTTVVGNTCYAVNVGQRYYDTPTAGPATYVYAVPAPCMTAANMGIWFEGAIERIDQLGTSGAISFFEVTPMTGEAFTQPNIGYSDVGEEVFVVGSEQMELKIGNEVITTYSYDVFVAANIAGTVAYGERTTRSCGPTGCIVGADSLSWGFVVLDKAVVVPPGTAMMNVRGQMVGTVIGSDKGMTLAVTVNGIAAAANQLGINLGGKG